MNAKPAALAWDDLSTEQKLAFLHSMRRDLLAQMRREIHTRGNRVDRQVDRIDRQIAALQKANPQS